MNGAMTGASRPEEISSSTSRPRAQASRRPYVPSAWDRLSIAIKLPVSLAVLLSLAFGGMTVAAYLQVRASAVEVASERLARSGQQMADLLASSVRQRVALIQAFSERAGVPAFVETEMPALRDPLVAAASKHLGAAVQTASVEIWSADGRTLLSAGASLPAMGGDAVKTTMIAAAQGKTAVVSPYRRAGNDVFYSVALAIRRTGGPIGYLVERRKLSSSGPTLALLTGLIGSDAKLLIGNADGEVWSDLATAAAAPPVGTAAAGVAVLQHRQADGTPMYARVARVPETPWAVAVEFPQVAVMNPARRFLMVAVGLSALLTAVGVLAGWRLSRRLTMPLRQVTEAAEAIAAARSAGRIDVDRADEVGRLATSFNSMAAQVEDSRERLQAVVQDLEVRVAHRTAALEAANRELEAFSYSVSHDLRAPLRAIDGFARILVEDHAPELTPGAQKCLDVITDRTKHMGMLIDDLLTFSRLGRQAPVREPIDMTRLASAVADELRQTDANRSVEIVVHPLSPARAERSLVKQVLVNLMQNALKFSRTRPHTRIEVACHTAANEMVYSVRDNGVGFDMAYADKLFGVFQRLHRAEDFEGTGVGLAIVQRIVNRHGGRVWAEAAIDAGATFFFTLPPETHA